MARTNVNATMQALENRPEIEQLSLDGDTATEEAVFRAILTGDTEEFERFVEEELDDVSVTKTKWVVFGNEVVLR